MANEQNLRAPFSPKEARENGSKGGKASGEAKRRKKTMKAALELLLEMDHKVKNKSTGKTETMDGMSMLAHSLFRKAGVEGDRASIELALKIIGQMPKEVISDDDDSSGVVMLSSVMAATRPPKGGDGK